MTAISRSARDVRFRMAACELAPGSEGSGIAVCGAIEGIIVGALNATETQRVSFPGEIGTLSGTGTVALSLFRQTKAIAPNLEMLCSLAARSPGVMKALNTLSGTGVDPVSSSIAPAYTDADRLS